METKLSNKILAFEYVLFKLTEWFMKENNLSSYTEFNQSNDLNKLKVIKLHFFVSAVNSNKNHLLGTFDKFYAMPYGHVESDIYNSLNELSYFSIDTKNLQVREVAILNTDCFTSLTFDIKNDIDESISSLKLINKDLINYNALELVELSHNWFSWQSMYDYARKNHRNSELIPVSLIKEENKVFELVY